jgi:hypothetical protein
MVTINHNNARIVGCHGNTVYRSVAWIPICVSVTWSPKFLTCGRFPWEAPTISLQLYCDGSKTISF